MKVLAYRLQSDAFGGLDKSIRRILRSGKEDGVGAPFDRRAPRTREGLGLRAGALLVREWNGKLERVMILEKGFASPKLPVKPAGLWRKVIRSHFVV